MRIGDGSHDRPGDRRRARVGGHRAGHCRTTAAACSPCVRRARAGSPAPRRARARTRPCARSARCARRDHRPRSPCVMRPSAEHGSRLGEDEPEAAHRELAEMHEMPVVGEAVVRRVLAHRRDDGAVAQREAAQVQGGKEQRRGDVLAVVGPLHGCRAGFSPPLRRCGGCRAGSSPPARRCGGLNARPESLHPRSVTCDTPLRDPDACASPPRLRSRGTAAPSPPAAPTARRKPA